MTDEGKEFDLIRRLFSPLAAARPASLGLLDDAAVLPPYSDDELIITTDCLVASVHFRPEDPPESVAARSLRVNLSDLAAMGAEPDCYTLALGIPKGCDDPWLDAFARQLGKDQQAYNIDLIGGDTVSTPGPMTISITAIGRAPASSAIRRSTAHPGDDVYVSGHIGDAVLGLAVVNGELTGISEPDARYLSDRFLYPSPRTTLGPALLNIASAMIDVSDGLIADLGHICSASGVGIEITAEDVPVSGAAHEAVASAGIETGTLLSGGDDYELAFTAAPSYGADIQGIARRLEIPVNKIGRVHETDSPMVRMVDRNGKVVSLNVPGGYQHQW